MLWVKGFWRLGTGRRFGVAGRLSGGLGGGRALLSPDPTFQAEPELLVTELILRYVAFTEIVCTETVTLNVPFAAHAFAFEAWTSCSCFFAGELFVVFILLKFE